ncbi:MAG TPA: WYL domain-containing protein [Arenimonas sp.]|uniref:helix-turn-helix transcriptional regulator n=1 Tax=Arenimonas sp. TaxID=1872635 RepID=UPI002D7E7678|nr:WYL domain-containing protein [Arenimonas sp.]HEU0152221.1 WYL domain-containing protein [Arenimonas sp.]
MLSTSARLLRLASLLQSRRHWPGAALADALDVEARTLRRDVERLRELGYPVEASSGVGGGYALGRGAALPPLMLDDDEAVALAIALRAASASVGGIEATSLQLMGKLDQLMPQRLRRRATALHAVTLSLRTGTPLVDAGLLSELATACRDGRALRFSYRKHAGETTARHVQPQRLANYGRRWYLIAWDIEREDWRSFRIDRIEGGLQLGDLFAPRPVPPDVAARLERGIAYAPFACRITLRLQGSLEELQAALPLWCGVIEPETTTHSLLRMGAETPEGLLAQVLMIDRAVEVVDADAVASDIGRILARMSSVFSRDGARVAP